MDSKAAGLMEKARVLASRLKELISEGKTISVISHLDADGISAAGIVSKVLAREEAPFQVRIIRQLRLSEVKSLEEKAHSRVYVFLDMGSGQIDNIVKYLADKTTVFILDHHENIERLESESILELNPHLYGVNGSMDLSGAGVSYLLAKYVNDENTDLSPLALVGAVGDIQDKGPQRTFTGINNDLIVADALKKDLIKVSKDILLFGSETRPIHLALKYTTDPFIEGITGEEDKCIAFLSSLNIPLKKDSEWRTLSDLDKDEKIRLYSSLVTYMLQKGFDAQTAEQLIGTKYIILSEEEGSPLRDIREYAYILNACGRLGYTGLGVALCIGDRSKALLEAQNILNDYRQKISKYLSWLHEPGRIKEMEYVRVIHGENVIEERMIGTMASIISRMGGKDLNKALLCFAYNQEGNGIKVSVRGNEALVKKGLNLSQALKSVIDEMGLIGSEAGGHDIAAGAEIPIGSENTFSSFLNKVVGSQLGEGE